MNLEKLLACALMAGFTGLAHAQVPLNPLPLSVNLFPTTLGSHQGVGLSLGSSDWDMSISLPRPRVMQGLSQPRSGGGNYALDRSYDDGFRNNLTGSVGAAWKFSASRLGVNYRIDASAFPDTPGVRSLGLSYGYQFRSGLTLSTNLDRGLSEWGSRWGGGLSISFSQ